MVLTPQQADKADSAGGFFMFIGVLTSLWHPAFGITLCLLFGFNAVCVAIDRHLPMDSVHRKDPK